MEAKRKDKIPRVLYNALYFERLHCIDLYFVDDIKRRLIPVNIALRYKNFAIAGNLMFFLGVEDDPLAFHIGELKFKGSFAGIEPVRKASMLLHKSKPGSIPIANAAIYAYDLSGNSNSLNFEKYSVAHDHWSLAPSFPRPTRWLTTATFQDRYLYCAGREHGYYNANIFLYKLDILEEELGWQQMAIKPQQGLDIIFQVTPRTMLIGSHRIQYLNGLTNAVTITNIKGFQEIHKCLAFGRGYVFIVSSGDSRIPSVSIQSVLNLASFLS